MSDQMNLFGDSSRGTPSSTPGVDVSLSSTRSILTPATGFMSDYDFTLNPYSGCAFACTYCYAAFFTHDEERTASWGRWVVVKEQAADAIRRMRRDLRGRRIYMSSVTDPYQPLERRTELTRSILESLLPHQPHMVIQTRGPLVTRDIDLLRRFDHLRVNVTVTTDDEEVRRAFEPRCPSNGQRLEAARTLVDAGIAVHITMTPLLPVRSPIEFARRVAESGASEFVVQPFRPDRGRFVAGTREPAERITHDMNWDADAYRATVEALRAALPRLTEGREGFAP